MSSKNNSVVQNHFSFDAGGFPPPPISALLMYHWYIKEAFFKWRNWDQDYLFCLQYLEQSLTHKYLWSNDLDS